jgi:hypothetical protein
VALLLFGLTAIALSIYGMTQADPTVVKDVSNTSFAALVVPADSCAHAARWLHFRPLLYAQTWSTVDVVTNYTNRLEDRFNELMGNLSRTTPIVAALQVCMYVCWGWRLMCTWVPACLTATWGGHSDGLLIRNSQSIAQRIAGY